MSIDLVSIYDLQNCHLYYSSLYRLIGEREIYEAISHSTMPTWKEHEAYLNTTPHKAWYVIVDIDVSYKDVLGSIYLSYSNEIGIGIFKQYRRKGYASKAIDLLMEKHPEKFYLANINPENQKSIDLFIKHRFKHIQNTYKWDFPEYIQIGG